MIKMKNYNVFKKGATLIIIVFLIGTITNNNIEAISNDPKNDENITRLMNDLYMTSLSAGIIENDELIWNDGYGSYRGYNNFLIPKEKKIPTKDTVYMAASISKSITATAMMQLYEKGHFNLSDKVGDHLGFDIVNPNYPDKNITIQMLLNHTSGLKPSKFMFIFSGFILLIKNDYTLFKFFLTSKSNLFKQILWLEKFEPGMYFNYSNIGYGVLELLIEIFSDKSYDDYCKENIFAPLEMYNTSFNFHDFNRGQLAIPYMWSDKIQMYCRLPQYNVPLKGAGSLRTSIEDLSHFLIAHMNNGTYKNIRILNNSTVNLMHNFSSKFRGDGADFYSGYGLGWMLYNASNISGHDGDTFGGHGKMKWNQTNDIGLIYFWNSGSNVLKLDEIMRLIDKLENELLKNVNKK